MWRRERSGSRGKTPAQKSRQAEDVRMEVRRSREPDELLRGVLQVAHLLDRGRTNTHPINSFFCGAPGAYTRGLPIGALNAGSIGLRGSLPGYHQAILFRGPQWNNDQLR